MSPAKPAIAGEPAEPRSVVMLVYPGVMAMDVFGPLEAFAMASNIAGRPLYRLAIAGLSLAPVESSLGIRITPSVAITGINERIDTLLVSGGFGQAEASCNDRLIAWLRASSLHARRCGSICNLLLAQFASSPPVRLVQEWALENLACDLNVKALAARANMSERTFHRAFAEETGETPRDFVERIRIDAARGCSRRPSSRCRPWRRAAALPPSTISAAPSCAAWASRLSTTASASAWPTMS